MNIYMLYCFWGVIMYYKYLLKYVYLQQRVLASLSLGLDVAV